MNGLLAVSEWYRGNRLEFTIGSIASACLLQQLWQNRNEVFGIDTRPTKSQPIAGLSNYSQLCYVNSLLQLLANMPQYTDYLDLLRTHYVADPDNNRIILPTVIDLLRKINKKCDRGFRFDGACNLVAVMSKGAEWARSQQDCGELWMALENMIEQECIHSVAKCGFLNFESSRKLKPFKWPTHFSTIRQMQCSICGERKEDRVENFHMLSMDQKFSRRQFKSDLEASLDEYFKSENVVVNCEKCANPNSKQSMMASAFDSSPELKLSDTLHVKNMSFGALPKHLCFMINAEWDPFSGNSFRSGQRWSYPDFLNLAPYCFSTHLQGGTGLIEKGYELGAVVVHVGSDNAGHYYVCRKIGNTWYKCNDTLVQMIPSGLNQHGAYILLYTKT